MSSVLPVNYNGQQMHHKEIHAEPLEVFTIANVKEGSKWFWTHCLALYLISCSACALLYFKDAEKMYRMLNHRPTVSRKVESSLPYYLLGGTTHSFTVLNHRAYSIMSSTSMDSLQPNQRKKECSATFVFFRTCYVTLVVAQVLQSSNPMLWVKKLTPEPHDVYWSNLSIPYKQVWLRKITTLLASVVFMFVFLVPVTFVQGLTQLDQLDQLSHRLPFLKGLLKNHES